ncbi:hypothetical protein BDF20DRAFT_361804 [Mycotypha africana]|uniref:uncharacterized protein n=1 Tax=Mycotypha africana TaxID=64632 RepID=UPI0023015312|nr:uncharacterized protein BDF20DRAFT_361804 [Mycotypha africana]KAI8984020.1 hypothetical protein BDF20DRAFT_361804 [Mycotypha africana]
MVQKNMFTGMLEIVLPVSSSSKSGYYMNADDKKLIWAPYLNADKNYPQTEDNAATTYEAVNISHSIPTNVVYDMNDTFKITIQQPSSTLKTPGSHVIPTTTATSQSDNDSTLIPAPLPSCRTATEVPIPSIRPSTAVVADLTTISSLSSPAMSLMPSPSQSSFATSRPHSYTSSSSSPTTTSLSHSSSTHSLSSLRAAITSSGPPSTLMSTRSLSRSSSPVSRAVRSPVKRSLPSNNRDHSKKRRKQKS